MRRAAAAAGQTSGPVRDSSRATGAGERNSRRWLSQLPYLVVLAGVAAGLAVTARGPASVRTGTLIMSGALLFAAAARLLLPEQRAGLLRARRRPWDVAALAVLGAGLAVAGLIYPISS